MLGSDSITPTNHPFSPLEPFFNYPVPTGLHGRHSRSSSARPRLCRPKADAHSGYGQPNGLEWLAQLRTLAQTDWSCHIETPFGALPQKVVEDRFEQARLLLEEVRQAILQNELRRLPRLCQQYRDLLSRRIDPADSTSVSIKN